MICKEFLLPVNSTFLIVSFEVQTFLVVMVSNSSLIVAVAFCVTSKKPLATAGSGGFSASFLLMEVILLALL
jgi:hypothetical protein